MPHGPFVLALVLVLVLDTNAQIDDEDEIWAELSDVL